MNKSISVVPATSPAQVAVLAHLAREIWDEHYVPLIGRAQVDYMVAKFQTAEAIQAQMDEGYEYFLLEELANPIGYLAIRHDAPAARIFVSKLYVLAAYRSSGMGRQAMQFVEERARERGATHLWLTVNKANPAVQAYQRMGFRMVEAVIADIGGSFVMDDFKMEKPVS